MGVCNERFFSSCTYFLQHGDKRFGGRGDVSSEDCHSEFNHRSSKTYASAPSGSNSNEIQRDRPKWNTRPNSGKIYLRFLAQGTDHGQSADWVAAGPRGRKNPEPGQRVLSSPTLLRLSSPTSALSSSYYTSGRAGYFFIPCCSSSQDLFWRLYSSTSSPSSFSGCL